MKPIVLTAEQRKEVELRRKKTLERRIYQRLTAVLAVAAGHTPEDVAQLLGVDLTQLSQWLRVFLNDGLEALCTLADGEPSPSTD
jgi:transcriptional regulator with XRE-family HTH domain